MFINRITPTLLLFIFMFSVAALGQETPPDSDFQVWSDVTLSFPVLKSKDESGKETDRLSLLVLGTFRLGQNRLAPVDSRIGVGFDYKIDKYWAFSPTYLYRRGEAIRDQKEYEHRVRFDLTVGNKWKKFSLRDRNRFEYRIRNSRGDSSRYRNRLTFAFPIMRKEKEIFSPFISEEVYYDITAKEFSANEIQAGITRKLGSNASADIFYVRRDFRGGPIRFFNGVGVNLKFRID